MAMEPIPPNAGQQQELLKKIKALMLLRVLVVTGFIGALIAFQKQLTLPNIVPISFLIATTYLLTIIYAVSLRWVKRLKRFCYFQIAGDILLEAGVIYITGGIDSPFSILFNFSIISASIILSRAGGYIIASLAAIVYGTMLDLQYFDMLAPIQIYPPSPMSKSGGYVFNIIYLNFCAFFVIAFLSGFLEEKLRHARAELMEKSGSLMELQAFHENVIHHMGDGLFTTDTTWKITSFNHAAEEITGFQEEEVKGRLMKEIFPFLEDRVPTRFMDAAHSTYRGEGKISRKEGGPVDVGITLSILLDNEDHVKGCIAVFQDLTYLKEMEKKLVQTERLAAIGQMSASLAHEIRNPLASVSGSVQVLKGELDLSGPNLRLMDIVVEEAGRLSRIISQFLSFANPKPPELVDTLIAPLIADTVRLLKNSPELIQGVEITTQLQDRETLCPVDVGQIKQVLWNVCLNGIQAMPEGGRLMIKTEKQLTPRLNENAYRFFIEGGSRDEGTGKGPMFKITITDEGCGIGREERMKIFEPFFSTKEKGSGLGLALVYRIIESHKGFIELGNNFPKGISFSLFLPL